MGFFFLLFCLISSLLVFEGKKLKIFAIPSKKSIEFFEGLNSFFFPSILSYLIAVLFDT